MELIKTLNIFKEAYHWLYKKLYIQGWWKALLSIICFLNKIKKNKKKKPVDKKATIGRTNCHWYIFDLSKKANTWFKQMRKSMRTTGDHSLWWSFVWDWPSNITTELKDFRSGHHQFSPMMQYDFEDEVTQVWSYRDRLMLHLILRIIKPTFKHVISPLCMHLDGPSAIKQITQDIKTALNFGDYNYFLRLDIRSYYASIDHRILLDQLLQNYDDPRLRHYFDAIVTTGIDCGGQVILPKKGIPLRSSLSPFFGALYLNALDRAFENRKGIFYRRYQDDIIILVSNKRQYTKARKRVFTILQGLRLKLSPHKSKMGRLKKGFHFLGVDFGVTRISQRQTQVATVNLHSRSCRRALDKVEALRHDAVHPANIQRYLIRWATWWQTITKLERLELIFRWVYFTEPFQPSSVWLGRGLLMDSDYDGLC